MMNADWWIKAYTGMVTLLFIILGLMFHEAYKFSEKCENAGGVAARIDMCVNPTAIIEVD